VQAKQQQQQQHDDDSDSDEESTKCAKESNARAGNTIQ